MQNCMVQHLVISDSSCKEWKCRQTERKFADAICFIWLKLWQFLNLLVMLLNHISHKKSDIMGFLCLYWTIRIHFMLQEQVIISRTDSSCPWSQLILFKLPQIMLRNTVQQTDTLRRCVISVINALRGKNVCFAFFNSSWLDCIKV